MVPTTERMAANADDYNCTSICPWLISIADDAINKFCEIFLDESPVYTHVSAQGYESNKFEKTNSTKINKKSDDPDDIKIPITTRHSRRRRPSRKKGSFFQYAFPQAMPKYPSSGDESDNSNTSNDSTPSNDSSKTTNSDGFLVV
jgi:hypothetical protein